MVSVVSDAIFFCRKLPIDTSFLFIIPVDMVAE